jgi:hypothetical protein
VRCLRRFYSVWTPKRSIWLFSGPNTACWCGTPYFNHCPRLTTSGSLRSILTDGNRRPVSKPNRKPGKFLTCPGVRDSGESKTLYSSGERPWATWRSRSCRLKLFPVSVTFVDYLSQLKSFSRFHSHFRNGRVFLRAIFSMDKHQCGQSFVHIACIEFTNDLTMRTNSLVGLSIVTDTFSYCSIRGTYIML